MTGNAKITTPPRGGKPSRRAAALAAILFLPLLFGPALAAQGRAPLAASDEAAYRAAFAAAAKDDWNQARIQAGVAQDRLVADVLKWIDYGREDTDAPFEDIAAFLATHADWPGLAPLRREAEKRMPATLGAAQIADWFGTERPLTVEGALRLRAALVELGRADEADAALRRFVVEADLEAADFAQLALRGAGLIPQDAYAERAQRLLWQGKFDQVRLMLPLLDDGHRALADARMRLALRQPGVDGAVARVPKTLADDEGLAFERMRWRRREGLEFGAIQMLDRQPADTAWGSKWWDERHILARSAMERGEWRAAYRVAAGHGLAKGADFAQAEWLAGWIALRKLGDPHAALTHFQTLYENVGLPLSLSRAAYWSGRAAEARRDSELARRWYEIAATWRVTFYGQLAALKLDGGAMVALPHEIRPTPEDEAAFEAHSFVQIARRLAQVGERDRAEIFLRAQLPRVATATEHALFARLAQDVERADWAVTAAKRAMGAIGEQEAGLHEAGYPMLPRPHRTRADAALVHSVIRQESSFNPHAVSGAGARGLMQLMPATAKETARKLGLSQDVATLTEDADRNLALGDAYLAEMVDRFGGSYVLAVGAYNAGPGRMRQWMDKIGDPRGKDLDAVVDWIEMIPAYETRNYVQRVMENLQVYRARMSGARAARIELAGDLRRGAAGAASAPAMDAAPTPPEPPSEKQ